MFDRRQTTLIEYDKEQLADMFNVENFLTRKNFTMSFMRKKENNMIKTTDLIINSSISTTSDNITTCSNITTIKEKIKTDLRIKPKTQPLSDIIKTCKDKYGNNKSNLKNLIHKKSTIIIEDAFHLDPNLSARSEMEDFVALYRNFMNDTNKSLYILCDGHCGDQVAKIVISKLPELFEQELINLKNDVNEAFVLSFKKMDEELEQYEDTGATCNIIYICNEGNDRVIYSANIGDSRAILIKQTEAIRLSYDHKAIDKNEIARVKSEGGLIIRKRLFGKLAITRAFGDFSFKVEVHGLSNIPTITRNIITESDRYIIIGSDGVWDVINEEKSIELITNNEKKDCTSIAQLFVNKSIEFGSKDNISCIVIKLN
jgi:serine/threonine protein phosphatase PrpC